MITLFAEKKDIESGQFPIQELQAFSERTGARVVIRGYAKIEQGIITYLFDRSMIICEALRKVQNEVRSLSCQP